MKEVVHHQFCKCQCEEEAKLDVEARRLLEKLYEGLGDVVNDANDLAMHFYHKDDKRNKKAQRAVEAIMKAQEMLNPMAEDEDIRPDLTMTTIAFTGHRSSKIGGFSLPNPTYVHVCKCVHELLTELKPEKCISGFAQGFDQYAAFVCLKLNIPYLAAIPHIGQEKIWPQPAQKIYHALLKKASETVIVSAGGYSAEKMLARNRWMVDNCDVVLACFDGTAGGTKYTVDYANTQKKPIHIIDPREAT